MSQLTEIRLDITSLFYPEDQTAPGETPYSVTEIKEKIEQKLEELEPGSSASLTIAEVFLDDTDSFVELCTTEISETLLSKAAIEAAQEFYPDLPTIQQDYTLIESDVLVRELSFEFLPTGTGDSDEEDSTD